MGILWQSKERDFVNGFIISLLLSPIVALIIGLIIKPAPVGKLKKCQYCAEVIKREAKVCKFCGREQVEIEEKAETIKFKPSAPNPVARAIRVIIIIAILALCTTGLYYGAKKGDLIETESVGSVMCLSCMGLQQ